MTEGGKPLARAAGVTVLGTAGGQVALSVAAGTYRFTSTPRR